MALSETQKVIYQVITVDHGPEQDWREGVTATIQHIDLLNRKRERLYAAQMEAEAQLLHRLADEYASGRIGLAELADAYQMYRSVAAVGFMKRWDASMPISACKAAALPRNMPNGPCGTWKGIVPACDGPAPPPGISVVYVLFDAENRPCYVGSTDGFRSRLAQHLRSGKSFVRWTAYPCTSREAAYRLECRLLAEHKPYLNKKVGR